MRDPEHPPLSIDVESFLPALAAGALDSCLAYLNRADRNEQSDAGLNCRLSSDSQVGTQQ
jgi:hypothetical protein